MPASYEMSWIPKLSRWSAMRDGNDSPVFQFRVTQDYEETTTVSYVRDAVVDVEGEPLPKQGKWLTTSLPQMRSKSMTIGAIARSTKNQTKSSTTQKSNSSEW